MLSIAQENQRPKSDYNSSVSQLFAFCLHSINGVNPQGRCVCFLLVSLCTGLGFPGQQKRCPVRGCVYPGEQREGITKLSHTGLACCPAALSKGWGAQPSHRLVACPQRKVAKSCLCVQHCFMMMGRGTSVLPVTTSPQCHSSPHRHKLSAMKKRPLDACWKPDTPGAKRGRFEWLQSVSLFHLSLSVPCQLLSPWHRRIGAGCRLVRMGLTTTHPPSSNTGQTRPQLFLAADVWDRSLCKALCGFQRHCLAPSATRHMWLLEDAFGVDVGRGARAPCAVDEGLVVPQQQHLHSHRAKKWSVVKLLLCIHL